MTIKHILAAVVLLGAPPASALGQFSPAGPEFQVNTYTTNSQAGSCIAADRTGDFIVAWSSFGQDGSGLGVFGRRFDSAGAPLGGEFDVNTYTNGNQFGPAVAIDGSGNFVVVWNSFGQDGSDYGVFARCFDSAGAALGGEFQVNTYTASFQAGPSVATDDLGNFVVVWTSYAQDGSDSGVFGHRFDCASAPVGGEFQVNTYTTGFQGNPSVAINGSGNSVVVWVDLDGSGGGVVAQRFDSTGASVGSEFQVNTYTTGEQYDPSVAIDGLGKFVVVWTSFGQDGSNYGVFARGFDGAGTPLGGEIQVNTYTTNNQLRPSVAPDGLGNFVVAWGGYGEDGSSFGVFARRIDGAASPLGGEFQINTYTTGSQHFPTIAFDGSSGFVASWTSNPQDGSSSGVFGQRFCADLDSDSLCNDEDVVLTGPLAGDGVDCSNPAVIQPVVSWDAGNYERFRVLIASDPNFTSGTQVTSGDRLLTSTTYTPPPKKWKSACKKALSVNPSSPVLYIKVLGVDVDVPKSDPNRKTFSQVVQVTVQ